MFAKIGVSSFDDLMAPIPESVRLKGELDVPAAIDEGRLVRHLCQLAGKNADLESNLCFLGAGIYDHFRPVVTGALAGRGEFATAYTPYQPEMSQGMLQAIYEYQTMICALTKMDLANASMYDAATGIAEAALMATSILNRNEILISEAVHPHYRAVLQTYADATGYTVKTIPAVEGITSVEAVKELSSAQTACVVWQQPNFFGNLEPNEVLSELAHGAGGLAIVSVDPISLGLLKAPGDYGADVVVGEGQALGSPMGFGGPLLGFFACQKKFTRAFPGRIVGATVDGQGRRGYTMTLRTREQDIRREKATSNICTNQALVALYATIYLSVVGKSGLQQVANLSLQKSHYAAQVLSSIDGVGLLFPKARFFKEFALKLPKPVAEVNHALLGEHIVGGVDLGAYYPEYEGATLLCVTETKTKEDIDQLAIALRVAVA
jgi:glycine dehydrogenase subunit 1